MYFYNGENRGGGDFDPFDFNEGEKRENSKENGGTDFGAPYGGLPYGGAPYPPQSAPPVKRRNTGFIILTIVQTVIIALLVMLNIVVTMNLTANRSKETTNDVNELARVVSGNCVNSVAAVTVVSSTGSAMAGSAFVAYSKFGEAYFITNYHVVEEAVAISGKTFRQTGTVSMTVAKANYNGGRVKAIVPEHDMAVLSISTPLITLPPVQFGDSGAMEYGAFALAIGNPYGEGITVSEGIISMPSRQVTLDTTAAFSSTEMLQTTAAINPGNSGGPLFDKDSRMIGMNTAKPKKPASSHGDLEPEGIAYAIGANDLKSFIAALDQTQVPFKIGDDGFAVEK